jgi:3-oxoadipate enol-lactonase
MPYAEAGGTRLYYERHGPKPGEAPAIVFAHGAGGNHLSWWQQVPHFRDRYTCVVFDHRGYGQSGDSDPPRIGAAFVDDLRGLLDHLGIDRAHLVAQSMGGWTCLGFALRYPHRVEKLVMCDTHGGLLSDAVRAAFAADPRPAEPLPDFIHVAAGARMHREQPALHFLYTEMDALNEPRSREEIGAILRAAGSPSADDVAALDIPVLFIAGEEDPLIPPPVLEVAAKHFRGAHVVRVAEAGHSVYFERAEQFNAIVDHFLSEAPHRAAK